MEKPEAQQEHRWLQRLAGEWTWEMDGKSESGEAVKYGGSERVKLVGEIWVVCEGGGNTPEGDVHESIMTLGFDPERGSFLGSFISSFTTHLWVYDSGTLASADRLELYAKGPSFTPDGGVASYRDTIEFVSENERTLTSHVQADDGSWTEFMTSRYRRA